MARQLVLIYGPPFAGKSTVAWQIVRSLPDKTAVISADALLEGAIAVPDADAAQELEMVHVQIRLLVANYLKNDYNVVVEGPFVFEREGRILSFEREIGELAALMRNLARTTLILRLKADEAILCERGGALEGASAARLQAAYVEMFSRRLVLDSGVLSSEQIVAKVGQALRA